MTSVSSYGTTGNTYIDGLLTGYKWAVTDISYSFPTSGALYGSVYGSGENLNGFEAFSAQQQAAVRTILAMYSSVVNLTFTETAETSTSTGTLRYAESDAVSTAWGYYPSSSASGGDMWFNNSTNYYDAPAKGNYAYFTMIHETGHALGLKHPHEANGSFAALPADKDSVEYTVMSYRSYVGAPTTGYTIGAASYPQTLMMLDIQALQKLYGANYSTNAGDSTYRWDAATGEMTINGAGQGAPTGNKVFMTLWDGGGADTYDLSNYAAGVTVNLQPGCWSTTSATQLASLGSGKVAAGTVANALLCNGSLQSIIENAIGGAGADSLTGNVVDNQLTGGAGNDLLDGLDGLDTACFSGNDSDYSWVLNADGSWTVTDLRIAALDGIDTLRNIEVLKFLNAAVTIGQATSVTATTPPPPPPPPPANLAPTAQNDAYTTKVGTALSIKAGGVLLNDSDPEGHALTDILVSATKSGRLSLGSDGSFTYTPNKKFAGTDSFTYKVSDGTNMSNVATVYITVSNTAAGGG